MSSNSKIWQEIKERFEFFLILAALCGCGYLTWYQLIWLIFMLIFGGVSAAMIPLYNIAQDKLKNTTKLDEFELNKLEKILQEAENILSKYENSQSKSLSKNSDQAIRLRNLKSTISHNIEEAKKEYKQKKRQREDREIYIEEQQKEKGFTCGVPPNENNECPPGYPIRVTENLPKDDPRRGIYYTPEDQRYYKSVTWCFKNKKEAEENNFEPPKNRKKYRDKF